MSHSFPGHTSVTAVNGAFALRAPFAAVSERIKSSGAAIIGYDTIESFSRLDEMILNDNDLFPPESVVLTGTKMYGSARIDEVIVSAASIFRALDGPLSSVMLSIIDGREELLRPVTEIKYQDERGILAFIEGAVVLVGNREFMAYNKVPVPNDNLDRHGVQDRSGQGHAEKGGGKVSKRGCAHGDHERGTQRQPPPLGRHTAL